MGIGNIEQLRQRCDGLVEDAVELLAAVAALGDAETLALVVDQGLQPRLREPRREHGRDRR